MTMRAELGSRLLEGLEAGHSREEEDTSLFFILRTSVSRFGRRVVQPPSSDGRTLRTACQELLFHPRLFTGTHNFILSNNSD